MKAYSRDRAASPARVRIEAAERILMDARHVSEEQSFDELLDVATRHQLDLVHLAEAFTEVADGTDSEHCAAELGDARAVVSKNGAY